MTRLLSLGTIALGAAALAVPVIESAPAAAVGNPAIVITLPAHGTLSSTGKSVRFGVPVTCSNMSPVPISLRLTQTRNQAKVTGSGTSGTSYKCNGKTQQVPVIVSAKSGHFNVGGATAKATATCGTSTCATATRNVQLVHKT
jgi:hypothetical protein